MLSSGAVERVESEPLQPPAKEVSLRFPENAKPDVDTGGAFDGNHPLSEPLAYVTRGPACRDGTMGYQSSIPEPPKREIAEAASRGVDPRSGFLAQPVWLSVLKKRQAPWCWLRWLFCNCCCHPYWTLTRGQWIWFLNLLLLVVYGWLTYMLWNETAPKRDQFLTTVFRQKVSYMAATGNSSTGMYNATLVDNKMPIRVDIVAGGVFLASAIIHLFVVALGPFDLWIKFLWRQLDLCFVYWRWIDYGITFPMTMMVLCCLTELRDENTLASIWMLCVGCVACFFLTELWSRPTQNVDNTYDMKRWTGDDAEVKPGTLSSYLSAAEFTQRQTQMNRRRVNYMIRTLPIAFGIFPFVALWWIFLNHFYDSRNDLRINPSDGILDRTPQFLQMLVYGTLVLSTLTFLPTLYYQWTPPMNHWKSEITNAILSAIFKIYFGYYVYWHVFTKESLSEAMKPL
jgi:hypothetical protein